jgi:pyruvate dehydrogenase E2 component (dihydrolipoamide acetyltransferase)
VYEFKLPDLGEGIHEGEIVAWHVAEGQAVAQDAPLVDVLTDKATVTIPSPVAGRLAHQAGPPGAIVKVGDVLAVLDTGEQTQATPKPPTPQPPVPAPVGPTPVGTGTAGTAKPAAPATRRLARELGIDLQQVEGTGPGGRVTPEDVESFHQRQEEKQKKALSEGDDSGQGQRQGSGQRSFEGEGGGQGQGSASAGARGASAGSPPAPSSPFKKPLPLPLPLPSSSPPPDPAPAGAGPFTLLSLDPLPDFSDLGPVEVEPLRGVRRLTARRMVTASLMVPHVAHFDEADVTALEALRLRHKERLADRGGPPLSLLPFALKAVTRALREFPKFNASVDAPREQVVFKRFYNLGVAVASPRGLIVPVIRQAERRSLVELAAEVARLAEAARDDKLDPAELRGGTFTVTNIGPLGGLAATPIVNYPEVAILALMRAHDKPVARAGEVVVRRILPLVLSFDHRLIDGADAARFVNRVVAQLEEPEALLLGA